MLSLVLDLLTHVNVNCFHLFMTSTNHFTVILLWKLGEFFQTFLQPLTEFGMIVWDIKLSHPSDTPLKLIENLQSNRKHRIVQNGQGSSWAEVSAWVPQGSTLRPLFFLMYINDLSYGLSSTTKHFADDTFLDILFLVVHDITQSTNELNYLEKISQ